MLTTVEMRLNSRAHATYVDSTSSSPTVLLANSGTNARRSTSTTEKFFRDNYCIVKFDAFGFSVKDFLTHWVLLRCDRTGDLYPVTKPSTIPHAFLDSQYTWHQRLGHPGSEVLRRLFSSNSILCNKEKPLVLCHDFQLGKHMRLSFLSSTTSVNSFFDIVHSDLWTFPIPSLSGLKYYLLFFDHYSQCSLKNTRALLKDNLLPLHGCSLENNEV
ncbi:ribonuclease H-like domain-containing protein [Tanacetum coccineum]